MSSKTGNLLLKIVNPVIRKTTIIEGICALFIILFVYTGLNKIMDYNNFKFQLGRSPFIDQWKTTISIVIPAAELLISLLLILKRTRLYALYCSFFIMELFTGYIWLMLNYAYDLPCSCGGILAAMSWNDHLIFNACFTLLAAIGVILENERKHAVVENR